MAVVAHQRRVTAVYLLAGIAGTAGVTAIAILLASLPTSRPAAAGGPVASAVGRAAGAAPAGPGSTVPAGTGTGTGGTAGTETGARTGGTADGRPAGHGTGTGSSPAASPGGASPTGTTGPRLVSFKITQQPKCPAGTAAFPVPAVPLKLTWKVTGATGVALSVDNPDLVGGYGRYGTEGALEFTFSCGGAVGSTETHTYTINTVGGTGPARRAELTASAKVLETGTSVT